VIKNIDVVYMDTKLLSFGCLFFTQKDEFYTIQLRD